MTSKTSRAYHFSWNYLPGIIDRVIDVSLSWCAGAGGMSISSALMPYNVEIILLNIGKNCRASPKDFDAYGYSLAKPIADLLEFIPHCNSKSKRTRDNTNFLRRIMELGVGDGSLGCPPRRPMYDDWAPEIVHIMALQGFDGHFAIASPRILLFLLRSDERMKDGYETGCLSRAILSRDVQQVAYILDKHPSAIEETTIMGQTPFHLAASSPECLSLLLGAGETSLVDKRDLYRKTPLQWAMELSVEVCKNDPLDLYTLCHGCNCAECLIMLLEAGCTLSTESVLWTAVAWSTFRSTLEFAKHLKVRRETLKQLALEHLTPEQSSELGLYRPSVLDGKSLQAVEILESMKVPIRPNPAIRFDTDMADYYGATEESVYQILDDPYVAELFFQEGFRDLEECSDEGWLPLQSWNPRYINWLLEHGANINAPMQNLIYNGKKQRIHPIPVANTVAANVGRNYRRLMPAEMHAFQCILSVILTCRDIDRCHCACSDHGCSPFLHFLKTYFSKKKELPAIRSEFLRFLYRFGHLLGGDDVRCAIRFLTFQVTILSHTCCHHTWLSSSFEVDLTSEEAAEVHELETADLRRFENLVAELIEDFDKTVLGMPTTREILVDFFDNHWAKRVALALEEDVDNTVRFSVQKREAERLGVVWGPQEAQVCVYEPEKKYEYEYCIGLMDKIMAGEEVDIDRLWEED
ncbi:hypothetical protein PG995_009826 [Apiospora arundinis]|uniref:Ankyrin n=1 Tax=Apiospora arundinis TaxID=335852 RepID=A0ABR2JLV0_9PEZI